MNISKCMHAIQSLYDKWLAFSPSRTTTFHSVCHHMSYVSSVFDFIKVSASSSNSLTENWVRRMGDLDAPVFQLSLRITWWHITKVYARALYSKSLEHSMCSALKYWWVSKNTLRPVTFRIAAANGSHKEEGWCLFSSFFFYSGRSHFNCQLR